MQGCSTSTVNALVILQSFTNPSIWRWCYTLIRHWDLCPYVLEFQCMLIIEKIEVHMLQCYLRNNLCMQRSSASYIQKKVANYYNLSMKSTRWHDMSCQNNWVLCPPMWDSVGICYDPSTERALIKLLSHPHNKNTITTLCLMSLHVGLKNYIGLYESI